MTVGPDQGGWGAPGNPWHTQQTQEAWTGAWGQGNAMPPAHPQQPGYGGWPPGPLGPPPRDRKPLIIGLSVLAVVVVVVVAIVVAVSFTGDDKNQSGGDTVKGYLDALARGDAAAALSYSADQPGSKDLMTDEILRQQTDKWPITNVRILDDDSGHGIGFGRVHVAAKFGDNESDVTLSVKKSGKAWKLDHAAIKVDSSSSGVDNAALGTLTFFGRSVGTSPVYVFPGYVDAASSNPNVNVKLKKPFLLDLLASSGSYFSSAEFSLSDTGLTDTMSAVSSVLTGCTRSNQLRPPNCPQHAFDPDAVDGTVTWAAPDMSTIKVQLFDQYRLEVLLSGQVNYPWTARTRSGGTTSGVAKAYVSTKADVSKSPPVVRVR